MGAMLLVVSFGLISSRFGPRWVAGARPAAGQFTIQRYYRSLTSADWKKRAPAKNNKSSPKQSVQKIKVGRGGAGLGGMKSVIGYYVTIPLLTLQASPHPALLALTLPHPA
jgi:hypothetical protein